VRVVGSKGHGVPSQHSVVSKPSRTMTHRWRWFSVGLALVTNAACWTIQRLNQRQPNANQRQTNAALGDLPTGICLHLIAFWDENMHIEHHRNMYPPVHVLSRATRGPLQGTCRNQLRARQAVVVMGVVVGWSLSVSSRGPNRQCHRMPPCTCAVSQTLTRCLADPVSASAPRLLTWG
jgi:hypothetical protein